MSLANVTLEQLCTAIECCNYMNGVKSGQANFSMSDIVEGSKLFAMKDTQWFEISTGALKGHRYTKTPHGLVVQAPKPTNEISLVQENTARLLGVNF